MKLDYTYSFADYKAIESARQHRNKYPRLRNWLFWALMAANVGLAMWMLFIFFNYQTPFQWWMALNLVIVIVALAYRYLFLPYWLHWFYDQQMLEGKKIQLNITDQGIDTATDSVTGQYSWQGFISASEEPHHFVVWVNNVQAICVPKRAFEHEGQMGKFREIITKYIAKHIVNQETGK
ncbi:MAG: YcxB family protein [Rhizobiaceae bacterium]|nr:YcxB family protein [Rhizobiaceae bacterium]